MDTPAGPRQRIQKVLAAAGHGSRRQIETWIKEKRLTVNGQVAQLGDSLSHDDRVHLDKKPLYFELNVNPRVIAYHKPAGELCTRSDPEGRATIFDHLPRLKQGRWVQVGRLDFNTSGLLLLTTDGELANRLMHPSSEVEREYAVRILGKVEPEMLTLLRQGVMLDDGMASFSRIKDAGGTGANHWYHVILKEGRKHEVKRLWATQGLTVSRLKRIRYGSVVLTARLAQQRWRELDDAEVADLLQQANLHKRPHSTPKSASSAKRATTRQSRHRSPQRKGRRS